MIEQKEAEEEEGEAAEEVADDDEKKSMNENRRLVHPDEIGVLMELRLCNRPLTINN